MTNLDTSGHKLRIAHTESSCGWGGQELRILTESEGMIRRGHDVRIVCPQEAPIYEAAVRRQIPVEALPIERRKLRGLKAARRWLRANHVDIVNTHSSTDSWLFSIAARFTGRRLPVVRTRHIGAPVPRNTPTRWLYVHGAHQVITCGERMRQAMIEDNRFPAQQVVSIPTGIDTDRFVPGDRGAARHRLGLPTDRILIGIVAALRGAKGHQYLADAIRRLNRSHVEMLIVGDGLAREWIEGQIQELQMTDRVRMVGHQEDVVPWLQAMDIFALPTWAIEGVPQSIMQAMGCQLPVVSTNVGSIEDAVTHEVNGLLVPPQDVPALTEALKTLIEDESLRHRFGIAGRRQVLAQFGLDHMLDRMEDVFRQVLSKAA